MVKYMLMITADMQNIKKLKPAGGVDNPSFNYYFKMKCGNCGEPTKEISVNANEKVSDSGDSPNLAMKCKFCEKVGSVTVISGKGRPLTQGHSVEGKYAPLMELDCRGYDPVEFIFGSGWKAESIAGTKFKDIDLSEGEFAEYDEKGECPVTIYNLRVTFEVMMSETRERRLAWDKSMLEWQRNWSAIVKARKRGTGSSSY